MEALRFVLGGALLLFGVFIVATNYVRQLANFRAGKRGGNGSSPAPFIGPLFIVVGYAALPVGFSGWIFLAFLVDPDTLITVLGLPALIRALRE